MSQILNEIVENKRREVEVFFPIWKRMEILKTAEKSSLKTYSMVESLRNKEGGIIAEFKRRSPSKGEIFPMADVSQIIPGYVKGGAGACSILTDTRFFGGSSTDLALAKKYSGKIPLLRKDFVVTEVQIAEARLLGASAVLLIASILTENELNEFNELAHNLKMEVLVEIHNPNELQKLKFRPDMLGVNNRNLMNFHTDITHSLQLINSLPKDSLLVAESGIKGPEDINKLKEVGFGAFLIGETLMRTENPGMTLKKLVQDTLK